jgi:hypothetical protein
LVETGIRGRSVVGDMIVVVGWLVGHAAHHIPEAADGLCRVPDNGTA